MDNAEKRGRPRRSPQTMPLFLVTTVARVVREIPISAGCAEELRAYLAWAGPLTNLPEDEALYQTIDRALGDYFKRDRLWQSEKAGAPAGPGTPTAPARAGITQPPIEKPTAPLPRPQQPPASSSPAGAARTS